jgi:hypothetical protein
MQNGRSRKSEVRNREREDERIFNSVIARRLAKIITSLSKPRLEANALVPAAEDLITLDFTFAARLPASLPSGPAPIIGSPILSTSHSMIMGMEIFLRCRA